jgi:hypothetical protein
VVERLRRLGDVYESQHHGGSLDGLRLFCIGNVDDFILAPERDTCTFKAYEVWESPPVRYASEHP